MEKEFWLERWQNQQTGFHRSDVNPYLLKYFSEICAGVRSVFVPLCGKSLDLTYLRDQGLAVTGVEISRLAVESFFRENNLTPVVSDRGSLTLFESGNLKIYCGDFFDLESPHLNGMDCIYDRASLIALPQSMRKRYAEKIRDLAGPAAKMMLITMEYPAAEMNGPPFSVSETEVRELFGGDFHVERTAEIDVLKENPQFANRGLSSMHEKIFSLVKNR